MKSKKSKKRTHKQQIKRSELDTSVLKKPVCDTKNYYHYTEIRTSG